MRKHERRNGFSAVCLGNSLDRPFVPCDLLVTHPDLVRSALIIVISAVVEQKQRLVYLAVARDIYRIIAHAVQIGRTTAEQAVFRLFVSVRLP